MRTMSRQAVVVLLMVAAGSAVFGCMGVQEPVAVVEDDSLPEYGIVSPEQAVWVIQAYEEDPAFVLLDIRTPQEVASSHIKGAVSLDFYSDTFESDLAALDPERVYLIYCRTGNRTGQTYTIMEGLGFTRVYDLGGGIRQWTQAGYPVCEGPLGAEHTCTGTLPALS